MLEIIDLRKEFDKTIAVKRLSFKVNSGEIFGLLGPNGAGKTTTIRCILNIIKPDSGQILLNGTPIDQEKLNEFGYLPEERGLYTKSKVIDVISYFAELKGVNPTEAKKRAGEYLKKLEIYQYSGRKVNELSKGNQQKVQLITSILHNPKVMILDEPFSGLDPVNQDLVKELFRDLLNKGKTIIFSTHQMETAEKLCNRITLINQGEEILSGSISEVKKRFGRTSLIVKYPQNPDKLKNYPEIAKADIYENYAELLLAEGTAEKDLMIKLINEMDIKGFEIKEPSLHAIFIESVTKIKKS